MSKKKKFPSREDLNEAFHMLQDQITRITVEEEEETISCEINGKDKEI